MKLSCPACYHTLSTLRQRGIEVDFCLHCGGTFFDKGELRAFLAGALTLSPQEKSEIEIEGKRFTLSLPSKPRYCPKCMAVRLSEFYYSYAPDIIVDVCPRCEGIWTDGGELEKLAQAIRSQKAPTREEEKEGRVFYEFEEFHQVALDTPNLLKEKTWGIFPEIIPPWSKSLQKSFCWVQGLFFYIHAFLLIFLLLQKLDFYSFSPYLSSIPPSILVINLLFYGILGKYLERELGSTGFLTAHLFWAILPPVVVGLIFKQPSSPSLYFIPLGAAILGASMVLYHRFYLRIVFTTGQAFFLYRLSFLWLILLYIFVLVLDPAFPSLSKDFWRFWFPQLLGLFMGGVFVILWKMSITEFKEVERLVLEQG